MIDGPQIVTTKEQLTAFVPLIGPRAKMQQVMRPAIHEVMKALTNQGIKPAGPLFTHHWRRPTDSFEPACREMKGRSSGAMRALMVVSR